MQEEGGAIGLDELGGFLWKKGAAELITEIGAGTVILNALVDAVAVNDSTVFSRLSEGVECEVLTANHKPIKHGTEKRYALTIPERRIYDWAAQTESERKVRKLRRVQHEHETAFERMAGKLNRDMEIRKMVTDSELVKDQKIDLPEGTSLVPKMASEEKLREAKHERMEANLKLIEELEDVGGTGEDSD